jgi:Zincin-like metallopeptidase
LSTLCHELCHWTSPESRCHRQLGQRFGDQAYAIEELVAELGAAFLCADLRITGEPRADLARRERLSWGAALFSLFFSPSGRRSSPESVATIALKAEVIRISLPVAD